MPKFTVDLTDVEVKAMEIVVPDVQEWLTNAAKGKANKCLERAIIEHDLSEKRVDKMTLEEKETAILTSNIKPRKERDEVELVNHLAQPGHLVGDA